MSQEPDSITIVTDSTCDLPQELIAQHRIVVVPLYVVWGQEELRDGPDITNRAFYARLPNDPIHPKTSQPTPADFAHAIRESGAKEVLIITIASALSGTYDSACQARELVDIPVHVVDSMSVSMGLGWQVLAAARRRDQGGDIKSLIAEAGRVRKSLSVLFSVDTLEFLHRGGRIGGAAKLLGTALQLKPLLTVDTVSGRVEAVERIRTRKKALQRILEHSFERVDTKRPLHVAVMHAAAEAEARNLLDQAVARYKPVETSFGEISPILGVHAGPGTVGMGVYND